MQDIIELENENEISTLYRNDKPYDLKFAYMSKESINYVYMNQKTDETIMYLEYPNETGKMIIDLFDSKNTNQLLEYIEQTISLKSTKNLMFFSSKTFENILKKHLEQGEKYPKLLSIDEFRDMKFTRTNTKFWKDLFRKSEVKNIDIVSAASHTFDYIPQYRKHYEYEENLTNDPYYIADSEKDKYLNYLENITESWFDKFDLVYNRQNLITALKHFYLNNDDLESNFILLDDLDHRYRDEIKNIYQTHAHIVDYSDGLSCKDSACKELTGITNIVNYFPYLDAQGFFEIDYDMTKYMEIIKFGQLNEFEFSGWHSDNSYHIDKTNPDYLEFRKQLYEQTIKNICDVLPDYLFTKLSEEQKINITNLYKEINQELSIDQNHNQILSHDTQIAVEENELEMI